MQKLMMAILFLSFSTVWAEESPEQSINDAQETSETVKYWIIDTDK